MITVCKSIIKHFTFLSTANLTWRVVILNCPYVLLHQTCRTPESGKTLTRYTPNSWLSTSTSIVSLNHSDKVFIQGRHICSENVKLTINGPKSAVIYLLQHLLCYMSTIDLVFFQDNIDYMRWDLYTSYTLISVSYCIAEAEA